ncbi:MAG TPA: hypothetical protein VFA43_12365 [Gemmatimonadaceae bacterium]|nr:hypothetical protein [Gemmatimonadaceae bacterium]
MLLILALLLQTPDSSLKALVDSAAVHNRVVPERLASYRAHIESEITVVLKRASGTESATQIEQVASDAHWLRDGTYDQHVVGYRAQMSTLTFSMLGFMRRAWTVPVLYGNRINVMFGEDTGAAARRDGRPNRRSNGAFIVAHPFAPDRDSAYTFSGGDTVVTLRLPGGRQVPVIRIHVEPRLEGGRQGQPMGLFRGDIFLDGTRYQIVRMRGSFNLLNRSPLAAPMIQTFFAVDLQNGEVDGQYWLPINQRIEGQVKSPFTGDARTALRVVSQWSNYAVNDTVIRSDTLRRVPHTVTFAPTDSLSRYNDWDAPLGTMTAGMSTTDFTDLAPASWRLTGKPTVGLSYNKFSDFFHFDRVEGAYTGLGGELRFRDAAPGLVARANLGYAWTEATFRGAAGLTWTHGPWTLGLRAARSLDNTNVFKTAFTSDPTIEALFTQDEYDYVDRRSLTASATRTFGPEREVVARVDVGPGDDRYDIARLRRPPIFPNTFMPDSLFRPNRGVENGSYERVAVTVDFHPDVDLVFVRPGIGAQLHYEWAGGDIGWQRVEARLVGRQFAGPFVLTARADGGIVSGHTIPPQQLFQIGTLEGLTAYDYKQFGGDQAAVLQTEVGYQLPWLRAPLRLKRFFLPAIAPELAVGVRSGWADASTAAARAALFGLGPRVNPQNDTAYVGTSASQPSGGFRTSVDFLVRAFGGALGVGAARALNGGGPHPGWSALIIFGSSI